MTATNEPRAASTPKSPLEAYRLLAEFWSDAERLVQSAILDISSHSFLASLNARFECGWAAPRYRDMDFIPRVSLDWFTIEVGHGSTRIQLQGAIQVCLSPSVPCGDYGPAIITLLRLPQNQHELYEWSDDAEAIDLRELQKPSIAAGAWIPRGPGYFERRGVYAYVANGGPAEVSRHAGKLIVDPMYVMLRRLLIRNFSIGFKCAPPT
ncbi:MAG: hypothetical protein EOP62_18495 [Sphingomonadales bacterium]|nr:MAG: hypothetical protein EOP62_18495 [Sphingomonadales bacterium]